MDLDNLLDSFQNLVGQKRAAITSIIEQGAVTRFAEAVGDLNPLYLDEAYARSNSPWRGLIAPPTFLCAIPYDRPYFPHSPDFSFFNVENSFTISRPVRVGEAITTVAVVTRAARRGARLLVELRCEYRDQRQELAGVGTISFIIGEKQLDLEAVAQGNPNQSLGPAYLAGVETPFETGLALEGLLPEQLRPGLLLPPQVKAPLTSIQLVKFAAASNDFNPIHFDKDYAISSGLPGVIAHGLLKIAFLAQYTTDCLGPRAVLRHITARYRGMDFVGDRLTSQGRVIEVATGEDHSLLVKVDLIQHNRRGEENTTGSASVSFV